jgi:SagB-type dehydrogenase family enzyme
MTEEAIKSRIEIGRHFMARWAQPGEEDFVSDQQKKLPQPPLVKAPMRETAIELPKNFEDLELNNDILSVINNRKSSRIYTQETMSLLQLSYLLWTTQGVKDIRGRSYATIRTVPCGGARHEFECYMLIQNVEGLEDGSYHYLPMEHKIELLDTKAALEERLGIQYRDLMVATINGQLWGAKSNVIFHYSMVAYRAEWRYGIRAHRTALIDAGHVTENLYIACSAANIGTCAIGSVNPPLCDQIFELDGVEEFSFYGATVGMISESNAQAEKDIYAFVKRDNL